jgi:hypothetical protein
MGAFVGIRVLASAFDRCRGFVERFSRVRVAAHLD